MNTRAHVGVLGVRIDVILVIQLAQGWYVKQLMPRVRVEVSLGTYLQTNTPSAFHLIALQDHCLYNKTV